MNSIESLDLQVAAIVAASPDWTVEEIIAHAAKLDAACQQFKIDTRRAAGVGVYIPHGYYGHVCPPVEDGDSG